MLDLATEQNNILLEATAKVKHAAIEDFANRLFKKIFPYEGVDKKTYAINAYAVEVAIRDTIKEVDNG